MATLPCPRCGSKEVVGTFCKECLRELHPLVKQIKPAKLVLCANCESVKPHSDWKSMPLDEAVRRAIAPNLDFGDAKITSVEFGEYKIERKPGLKRTTQVLAVVTGHVEGARDYEEEYDVPLSYEVTVCPHCGKKGTAYFEGILQIRNQTPAVRKAVYDYLSQHKAKGLRLAKEVPVASGSDYYISDQRAVNHLAKQLHASFGGELKANAQHFSYDHAAGKNLYRVNAYLEIPDYTKGDVIRKDDQHYYVLGMSTKVKAENLATGEQENFPYQKGTVKPLPVKTTQVSSINPVEVLHPDTFQSVTPMNSKYAPAELDVDDEVSVAVDGRYVFLIPRTEEKSEAVRKKKRHSQKRGRKDDELINEE
jgi:NMD protein affecting ribosome stability and mRNA decay